MANSKNILVTGGAGYIGSHCCKALYNAGFTPVTFDDLSTGNKSFVKWGPLVTGNILDTELLTASLKKYEPVSVLHLAAVSIVSESVSNPDKYFEINVQGTKSLLDSMLVQGVNDLIFSSSASVYGTPSSTPIRESDETKPQNAYGQSKLEAEKLILDYTGNTNVNFVSLRYFNAAGADPEGLIGESRKNETHLIPLLLETASEIKPSINIYGDDYNTTDGTCIRDYVHVTDIANAHLLSLNSVNNKTYNLGNNKGYSVKEIIQIVEKVTSVNIETNIMGRREGDPDILIASYNNINKDFNWNPKHSDIDNIIYTAWNWFKNDRKIE